MYLFMQSLSAYYANGDTPKHGRSVAGGTAAYNVYETKDGKHITLEPIEPWFFANLFRAVDREDFIPL